MVVVFELVIFWELALILNILLETAQHVAPVAPLLEDNVLTLYYFIEMALELLYYFEQPTMGPNISLFAPFNLFYNVKWVTDFIFF